MAPMVHSTPADVPTQMAFRRITISHIVAAGPQSERPCVRDELETLYLTTYTAVVRFLYRKVWDADRAEDLAQEVFVRAMAHRPEKPRAWVFAVAANLARDEARAAVRRKRHLTLLQEPIRSRHHVEPAADERRARREDGPRSSEALDALSPRDREVLLLWDAGPELPGNRGTDRDWPSARSGPRWPAPASASSKPMTDGIERKRNHAAHPEPAAHS